VKNMIEVSLCLQEYFVTNFQHSPTSPPTIFVTLRHRARQGGKVRNRPIADIRSLNLNGSSPTDSGRSPQPPKIALLCCTYKQLPA
jgi:hypothetical protein